MFLFQEHALLDTKVSHILLMAFELGIEAFYDANELHFGPFPLKVLGGDSSIFLMEIYILLSFLLTLALSFEQLFPKLLDLSLLLRDVRFIKR
jgi:hypothetical protein